MNELELKSWIDALKWVLKNCSVKTKAKKKDIHLKILQLKKQLRELHEQRKLNEGKQR